MDGQWFSNPDLFGAWYGTLVGGIGGPLAGALGSAAGRLAPQGKGRGWILGGLRALLVFGVVQLLAGMMALATHQPYGIFYPLLLGGFLFTLVIGINYPNVRRTYDQAEARRLDAQAIRNG